MLRVFIVRLSCQRMEGATVLLDPIFSWLNDLANQTMLSDMEAFKVHVVYVADWCTLKSTHIIMNMCVHSDCAGASAASISCWLVGAPKSQG